METKERLRWAVKHNKINTVELILSKDPSLLRNVDPVNGWSNLHLASFHGHYTVCAYLINQGHEKGSISLTHDQETALHLAARGNHEKVIHFLAQHISVATDWVDKNHKTALMVACQVGHHPCVTLLIDFGADLDIGDHRGTRPIHEACARGHVKVLRTLIDRGCNTRTPNLDGWRPVDFSMNLQVQKYFESLANEPTLPRKRFDTPSTPTEQSFGSPMAALATPII